MVVEGPLQHRELNTHATYDAAADQRATMVSLSVPPPHPRVPPAPAPLVPAPVIPRPIPVVPAPTPVFPPPALVLYQVPNLVGDYLVTAERVLVQDRLTIGLIAEQQSGQPAGTIVQQTQKPIPRSLPAPQSTLLLPSNSSQPEPRGQLGRLRPCPVRTLYLRQPASRCRVDRG